MADAFNMAYGGSSDWPKETLDFMAPDGTHMVSNVEELRETLAIQGLDVDVFKTKDAYRLALNSGNYPWLKDL